MIERKSKRPTGIIGKNSTRKELETVMAGDSTIIHSHNYIVLSPTAFSKY